MGMGTMEEIESTVGIEGDHLTSVLRPFIEETIVRSHDCLSFSVFQSYSCNSAQICIICIIIIAIPCSFRSEREKLCVRSSSGTGLLPESHALELSSISPQSQWLFRSRTSSSHASSASGTYSFFSDCINFTVISHVIVCTVFLHVFVRLQRSWDSDHLPPGQEWRKDFTLTAKSYPAGHFPFPYSRGCRMCNGMDGHGWRYCRDLAPPPPKPPQKRAPKRKRDDSSSDEVIKELGGVVTKILVRAASTQLQNNKWYN